MQDSVHTHKWPRAACRMLVWMNDAKVNLLTYLLTKVLNLLRLTIPAYPVHLLVVDNKIQTNLLRSYFMVMANTMQLSKSIGMHLDCKSKKKGPKAKHKERERIRLSKQTYKLLLSKGSY